MTATIYYLDITITALKLSWTRSKVQSVSIAIIEQGSRLPDSHYSILSESQAAVRGLVLAMFSRVENCGCVFAELLWNCYHVLLVLFKVPSLRALKCTVSLQSSACCSDFLVR